MTPFDFSSTLSRGRKYLVGVSGGCDSMVLLHALHAAGFRRLVVCHLDHRTRGTGSAADARFVERTARRLGLPCDLGEADAPAHARSAKVSLESAARDLRHAFFSACATAHRCRRVILAHHADDQVETCLFHFLRGSGAAGLGGMKPVAQIDGLEIHRPLLRTSRTALQTYARVHRVAFRDDPTNAGRAHTRNRLRHDVLPAIAKAFGPTFPEAILRAADILRAEDAWMEIQVPAPPARLRCVDIRNLPLALRRRYILRWLKANGIFEPGFAETERVLTLLDPAVAKVNLPRGRHARRRAGEIFLE